MEGFVAHVTEVPLASRFVNAVIGIGTEREGDVENRLDAAGSVRPENYFVVISTQMVVVANIAQALDRIFGSPPSPIQLIRTDRSPGVPILRELAR